ncbi:MAG: LPS assembly protein LptD [Alphaproteobacteria bacterium]|nr:LPS assembly protein LptD [Alphaproteobacteria bacterium]
MVHAAAPEPPPKDVAKPVTPNSPAEKKTDYLLSASEIENDNANQIVTARGAVEIHNDQKIMQADNVQFEQKTNVMHAQGNIAMIMEDNNLIFAKESTMSSDFANGTAKNVAMLMTDNTRMIANDARRIDSHYMVFSHGLFSPCDLCKGNPRKAPLWQVRASKITHDAVKKNIMYRDARLELWGVPLLYTPYMSHPDPSVKRRQGLLNMKYSNSPSLGHAVVVPYYFDIAPDMDYTFKPNFNKKDNVRLSGTLRKRFENGDVYVEHSLAITDRIDDDQITKYDQIRGHLQGYAHFNIDNIFRTGTDFSVVTDKNYLPRYGEAGDDVLTNRIFLEGFKGRGFGAVEMFYFQDNRPGSYPEQPLILPRFRISQVGEPNMTLGGRWSFDGDATVLQRTSPTGQDVKKIGTDFGWERRDVLPLGFVSTIKTSVRNDTFMVDHLISPDVPGRVYNNDVTNRLFPQGQITFSYPLAGYAEDFTHTVEPIFALSASPTRKLDPRIPNEDSTDFEMDTSNIFDLNRYPGTDRLEQGIRAAYGIKTGFYNHSGGFTELTIAQSYRLSDDPLFPKSTGLDSTLSDYVGQFKLEPNGWVYADYTFRYNKDLSKSLGHEVTTNFGFSWFRPHFTYTYIDQTTAIPNTSYRVEELKYGFASNFLPFWTFVFDQNNDLRPGNPGPRSSSYALTYDDECFTAAFSLSRDLTVRTGVSSGDTVLFHILFKHLGGIDG